MKPLQSFFHQNPVFILQIHHITDCSDSCKWKHFVHQIHFRCHFFIQRFHHFHCNYCTAKSCKRIGTGLLFWIDYGICRWQNLLSFPFQIFKRHLMMICHDHGHSQIFCFPYLRHCSDSIITGNNRISPLLPGLFNQMFIDSISVCDPVWNHHIHITSKPPETLQ